MEPGGGGGGWDKFCRHFQPGEYMILEQNSSVKEKHRSWCWGCLYFLISMCSKPHMYSFSSWEQCYEVDITQLFRSGDWGSESIVCGLFSVLTPFPHGIRSPLCCVTPEGWLLWSVTESHCQGIKTGEGREVRVFLFRFLVLVHHVSNSGYFQLMPDPSNTLSSPHLLGVW